MVYSLATFALDSFMRPMFVDVGVVFDMSRICLLLDLYLCCVRCCLFDVAIDSLLGLFLFVLDVFMFSVDVCRMLIRCAGGVCLIFDFRFVFVVCLFDVAFVLLL